MKLKQTKGRDIPGIPGATLRRQIRARAEEDQEEFLARLLEANEEESERDEFVPQQKLVEQ